MSVFSWGRMLFTDAERRRRNRRALAAIVFSTAAALVGLVAFWR